MPRAALRGERATTRTLLASYAQAWTRLVLKGSSAAAAQDDEPIAAAYLEPFAGADHPLASGTPAVAVEVVAALFAGVPSGEAARVRARLEEEDPVKVDWLHEGLRAAGLGDRVGRVPGAEIELLEGEWGKAGEPATAWDARATLAVLDPQSARRLPLERLAALAQNPAVDVLLRFPVGELRRLAEYRVGPLADLPPYARRIVEGVSRLLGDSRHAWVAPWRAALERGGAAAAEASVVDACCARVQEASAGVVRRMALVTAAAAAPEYLLLVTAEPARALLFNEVVEQLRGEGRMPWPELEGEFVRHVPRGELELFGGESAGGPARDRVVDTVALAHCIATRFAGRTVRLGQVLTELLHTELFTSDVRRALTELRRDGRALFRSLSVPEAEIAFPRAGGRRVGGRSSASRAGRDANAYLFEEPGSE